MITKQSFDIDPNGAGKARFFAAFATRQSRANVFKTSDACLFGPFSCYRKSSRPPFPPPSRTKGALSAAVRRDQGKMPNEPNWATTAEWELGIGSWVVGAGSGQAAGQGRRSGSWDLGDRHVDFGENGKARIDPVLVRKRAFLETFGLVTVEAKEPPLSCKSDHVSPYWYIRGVTPHRRIRRL
jgi:hypothetical protein